MGEVHLGDRGRLFYGVGAMQGCDPSVGSVYESNRGPGVASYCAACRQESESGGVVSGVCVLAGRVCPAPGV